MILRAKVSFAILQSALLFLRGLRSPRRRNLDVKDRDLEIEKGQAGFPRLNSYRYFIIGMYIEIFFFFSLYTVLYICSVENHWSTM